MDDETKKPSRLKMWRPRFPEREEQCASCPFLKDNDEQFGKLVTKLREKDAYMRGARKPKPPTKLVIAQARHRVELDVRLRSPDFACHASVYGPDMETKRMEHWRQCPGATAYARKLEE